MRSIRVRLLLQRLSAADDLFRRVSNRDLRIHARAENINNNASARLIGKQNIKHGRPAAALLLSYSQRQYRYYCYHIHSSTRLLHSAIHNKRTRDLSQGDGREARVRLTASRSLQRSRGRWVERLNKTRGYHHGESAQQGIGWGCTCGREEE